MTRETGGPDQRQETALTPRSWEALVTRIKALYASFEQTRQTGKELLRDPEIRQGGDAALRSVVNVAISCIDIVPGAGELASWGADVAAIVEEIRYRKRRGEAEDRGEDPNKVTHEKYNLTPDVSVWIKTLTEILEFVPAPLPSMLPTHAIETAGQLYYDIPRMITALKKARVALVDIQAQHRVATQAAEVFTQKKSE